MRVKNTMGLLRAAIELEQQKQNNKTTTTTTTTTKKQRDKQTKIKQSRGSQCSSGGSGLRAGIDSFLPFLFLPRDILRPSSGLTGYYASHV